MSTRAARTTGTVTSAVAAAFAIVALLVGVPVALWVLGRPLLPNRVPDWSTITGLVSRPDDGSLLLGFLVIVASVAWAVLALSILLELVAAVRRRTAPRIELPGFRLARVLAGVLVAALLGAGTANAAPVVPAAAVGVAAVAEPTAAGADDPAPDGPMHVVAARETLWSIAESTLGDPLRWREIFDRNVGLVQDDGGRLTDAATLSVGWRLILPSGARDTVVVRPGDTLTGIARTELGSADRAGEVYIANAGTPQSDGTSLHDPDRLHVGWRLVVPQPPRAIPAAPPSAGQDPAIPPAAGAAPSTNGAAPGPAIDRPIAPSPVPPPTLPTPPVRPSATPPPRSAEQAEDDSVSLAPFALAGMSGTVLAAAMAALMLRRRRQRRMRLPRQAVPVPDDAAGRVEWTARNRSSAVDYIDLALRSLTGDDATGPAIATLSWNPDHAVVVLAEGAPAREPFQDGPDGTWTLSADEALPVSTDYAAGACAPYPALVSIGIADNSRLMIDLEQRGIFRIGGDPERAGALLRHLTAELATGTIAEDVEVLLVGLDDDLAALDPERVHVPESLDAALTVLERRAASTAEALARHGLASVTDGRLREIGPDSWLPTVLVCGTAPDRGGQARLAALPTGAAVAVAVLDLDAPDLTIDPDGSLHLGGIRDDVWQAAQLTPSAGTHLATLLGTASLPAVPVPPIRRPEPWAIDMREDGSLPDRPPDPVRVDPPMTGPPPDAEAVRQLAIVDRQDPQLGADLASWLSDVEPAEPMIGILGEPTVRAPGPTPKTRASWFTEVLVYLTLHPHGVSTAKAVTDLWPEGQRIDPSTIRHAFYGARRWAGRGLDGEPDAPFVSEMQTDTTYRLRGHLLDWDLFRRLRKRGQARHRAHHDGAVEDYRAALGLVRGPILHPLRPGGYAWLNNHDQRHDLQIPGFVLDAAHELVDIALAAGDTGLARATAEQARAIDVDVVYDRPLTDLMRVAHAEDNQAELEFYAATLLDARGFDVPEELAPDSFTVLNDLLPAGPRRRRPG